MTSLFGSQRHLVLGVISQIIKVRLSRLYNFGYFSLSGYSFITMKFQFVELYGACLKLFCNGKVFMLCTNCYDMQIQLLADLNLKKTPQLVELVDDSKVRTA